MDLSNKSPEELVNLVQSSEDKETLRAVATHVGATFSGNTGVEKLKNSILSEIVLDENPDQVNSEVKPLEPSVILADPEDNDTEGQETPTEPDPAIMAALRRHQTEQKDPKRKQAQKLPDLATLVNMNEREPGISEPLRRAIVRAKALRLVRCRITNLDPQDAAVPAALITVYNKYTGKVSKLIPFGEENEVGYHVPKILLDELRSRTFNMRKEKKKKGSSFGVKEYTTVQVKKFAIEELPPLTKNELQNLANDQKARGAIDQSD